MTTIDTGQKWLGAVPSTWHLAPLGTIFQERKETVSDTEFPALSVTKGGVVPQLEDVAKTVNNDSRKLVRAGDFVINSRSDRKGSSGVSALDGSVSVIYTVLQLRDSILPPYAHHLLRSTAFQEEYYRWGTGIVADLWSTRYSSMKQIMTALPPLNEQQAIADYLDHETQMIDELIAEQRGLIETLRERRQAVIESSVFGLDKDVVRTARIEPWLPALPATWEAMQLGFVTESQAGYAFPSEGFKHGDVGTRLLRGINVKPDGVDWSDRVTWDEVAEPIPSEFVLETGDIVLGMDRPFVGAGIRVTVIREEDLPALLVQRVLRVRAAGEMGDEYLRYVLRTSALKHYLEPMFTGVSVPHISEWQMRKFVVPVPPLNEQSKISAYLDDQTSRTDALIAESEDLIALSQERRAALITAAVTGQIDVRTAA